MEDPGWKVIFKNLQQWYRSVIPLLLVSISSPAVCKCSNLLVRCRSRLWQSTHLWDEGWKAAPRNGSGAFWGGGATRALSPHLTQWALHAKGFFHVFTNENTALRLQKWPRFTICRSAGNRIDIQSDRYNAQWVLSLPFLFRVSSHSR